MQRLTPQPGEARAGAWSCGGRSQTRGAPGEGEGKGERDMCETKERERERER